MIEIPDCIEDYAVKCPNCQTHNTIYDMNNGCCVECGADLRKARNWLFLVLKALGYRIVIERNALVIPEDYDRNKVTPVVAEFKRNRRIENYVARCSWCGATSNLYEISQGICPKCGTDMKEDRNDLMRTLFTIGCYFACDADGNVAAPAAHTNTPQKKEQVENADENLKKTLKKSEEKTSPINAKTDDYELCYLGHEVRSNIAWSEYKTVIVVCFRFKNTGTEAVSFETYLHRLTAFQNGIQLEDDVYVNDAHYLNTLKQIQPGYDIECAATYAINDLSEVDLEWRDYTDDYETLVQEQTLSLEKTKDVCESQMIFAHIIDEAFRCLVHKEFTGSQVYEALIGQYIAENNIDPETMPYDSARRWIDDGLLAYLLRYLSERIGAGSNSEAATCGVMDSHEPKTAQKEDPQEGKKAWILQRISEDPMYPYKELRYRISHDIPEERALYNQETEYIDDLFFAYLMLRYMEGGKENQEGQAEKPHYDDSEAFFEDTDYDALDLDEEFLLTEELDDDQELLELEEETDDWDLDHDEDSFDYEQQDEFISDFLEFEPGSSDGWD